ncbi:MAG: GNAT family N-acetyltransferase [Saprospiraceae bacterium]
MRLESYHIETERLFLIPLKSVHLELLKESRPKLEEHLGLNPIKRSISEEMETEMAEAMDHWLNFTNKFPEEFCWGTNWEMVFKSTNQSIGSIGLSGLPNENGEVAIGYVVDDNFQKKGIASEAVRGLVNWVFMHENARIMIAYTPVENLASQKVLEKNGFSNAGEIEEDGQACFLWKKYNTTEK